MIKRFLYIFFALSLLFSSYANATTRAIQIDLLLGGLTNPTTSERIASGTVEFYEAGTTTPKNVWTEKEKINPYTSYTLNGIGAAHLYAEGNYKLVIKDSEGGTVQTLDNIRLEFPYYGIRTVIQTGNQLSQDDFLLINTTSGDVTINALPAAQWTRPLKIQRISGTNDIIFTPDGAETVDSSASLTISSDAIVEIISDGSNLRTAGFRSASVSPDGTTKIEVENTIIKATVSGTEIVDIDASGLDIVSGALRIGGVALAATPTELDYAASELDGLTVGGTSAGDILDNNSTQNFSGKTSTDGFRVSGGALQAIGNTTYNLLTATAAGRNYLQITPFDNAGSSITLYDYGDSTYPGQLQMRGFDGSSNLGLQVLENGVINIPIGLQIGGITQVKSATTLGEASGYPVISATEFDILSNISAAWESVGPTGSSATNIWTAMDGISSGATWVKLRFFLGANQTSGLTDTHYITSIFARKTGTSASITGNDAKVAEVNYYTNSAGHGGSSVIVEHTIPLDANLRFDLYRYELTGLGCTGIEMRLVKWGY